MAMNKKLHPFVSMNQDNISAKSMVLFMQARCKNQITHQLAKNEHVR